MQREVVRALNDPLQEGVFTVLVGFCSFWMLPRVPMEAYFLSDDEKLYVQGELLRDGAISHNQDEDRFSWMEVRKGFRQVHVWVLSVVGFVGGKSQELQL